MHVGHNWADLWQQDEDIALPDYLGNKICVCMSDYGKHEIWRKSSLRGEWCLPMYISAKDSNVQICMSNNCSKPAMALRNPGWDQSISEAPVPPRAVLPAGGKPEPARKLMCEPSVGLESNHMAVVELTIPVARGCAEDRCSKSGIFWACWPCMWVQTDGAHAVAICPWFPLLWWAPPMVLVAKPAM